MQIIQLKPQEVKEEQWTTLPAYTMIYNGNTNIGGSAPVDGGSPYVSGSTVTALAAGTLVKTGYSFAGWNTLANGTGTAYAAAGTSITLGDLRALNTPVPDLAVGGYDPVTNNLPALTDRVKVTLGTLR